MGKDTPFITEGDDESDVETKIFRLIGCDHLNYNDDEDENFDPLPPREVLNEHLLNKNSKLNKLLEMCEIGYLEFLILGVLILRTGAVLPNNLKQKILKTAEWETEKERWKDADEEFIEMRKEILSDFRKEIKNYKPGKAVDILYLGE